MKISAKQYATALMETLEGKRNADVKKVIRDFILLLLHQRNLGLADKIIEQLEQAYSAKENVLLAQVTWAREPDAKTSILIKNYISELTGAKKVSITEIIDKNILGGALIRYGDKILDITLKNQIQGLKRQLIK